MNIIIFIVVLIELLFLILGSFYLIVKSKVKYVKKSILVVLYFITFILLNVMVIILINSYYIKIYNNRNIDYKIKEINLLKHEKEDNLNKIVELEEKLEYYNFDDMLIELDILTKQNDEYFEEIKNKENELNVLKTKLDNLEKENDELFKKTSYLISPFPTYNQFPNYPNGCESVALYLLLKYNGVDLSIESIVEKLKKGDRPFRKNGKLYGGDPEVEFVGEPRSKSGYGVFEEPIIDVANQFKNGIKNITGSSLKSVLTIVSEGKPVQVWVSINLRDTYICSTWTATSTGRTVNWLCGLHSLVIIGYTYKDIITSDPYTGKIEYYDREQFEKMYNTYGKRALYYE